MWYEPNEWGRTPERVTRAEASTTAIPILVDLATYAPEAMTWAELDLVITARADTHRSEINRSAALACAELTAVCAATPSLVSRVVAGTQTG
jgi:hypothetical protein